MPNHAFVKNLHLELCKLRYLTGRYLFRVCTYPQTRLEASMNLTVYHLQRPYCKSDHIKWLVILARHSNAIYRPNEA